MKTIANVENRVEIILVDNENTNNPIPILLCIEYITYSNGTVILKGTATHYLSRQMHLEDQSRKQDLKRTKLTVVQSDIIRLIMNELTKMSFDDIEEFEHGGNIGFKRVINDGKQGMKNE